MRLLKQSTARNVMVLIVQSSDHITGLAGATLTITASKDGGAFGSITPTVTDRGSGWYNLALTTSHTDTLGDLALHITATSADPVDLVMTVVALDLGNVNQIGDAMLQRDMSSVEASAPVHSLTTAILKAVCRVRNNAGTLEVFKTDAVTVKMSQTVTTDPTNQPVDELASGA
jgi:hypothetical protein